MGRSYRCEPARLYWACNLMRTSASAPSPAMVPGNPVGATNTTHPTRPVAALVTTLAVQASATIAMTTPSVLAPAVAPLLGFAPQRIGWFVGIAYFAAMFSGLIGGTRVNRMGAVRMSAWALYACTLGLILATSASLPGAWPLLLPAAVAIGIGYGLPNPAASLILSRHAPPARRGLFFSIKQTGVPVGIGITGLLVPLLLGWLSWPLALSTLAALSLLLALGIRRISGLDTPHATKGTASAPSATGSPMTALIAPLRRVWRTPELRRLGVASLVFSMTQLCFVTFLVSYLKLEHGLSLAAAAGILSASQLLSMGSRIFWGQVSDRWVAPTTLLGLLGIAMGIAAMLLGSLPSGAPTALIMAAALGCAGTSMAWNGVFFADLAHRVPPEDLATVTGGTQFLTFCGAMIGPVVFASLVGPLGGHGLTYQVLAGVPLLVGVWLLIGKSAP